MKILLSILLLVSILISIDPATADKLKPSDINSTRTFNMVFEQNEIIQKYIKGKNSASPEVLIEILSFLVQMNARQPGLNPKSTQLMELAEEVAVQIESFDAKTRRKVQGLMDALMNQFPTQRKNEILVGIQDRFWFWSPVHLDYFASKTRNGRIATISTQLLWVLERAEPDEIERFFSQIIVRYHDRNLRWLTVALAYKYGQPVDVREIRILLKDVNPDRMRPKPLELTLDGEPLPTIVNLYYEIKQRLEEEAQDETSCARGLV